MLLLAVPATLGAAGGPTDAVPAPVPAPPAAGDPLPGAGAKAAASRRTVSAWLPYWEQKGGYRTALRHAEQLHTVSPFWYRAESASRITGYPGAGDRKIINGLHKAGIKVVPTVNENMAPGKLAAIVTSPQRRTTHVRALMKIVGSRSYDGLDLDYETIAPTGDATYKKVRSGYTALVKAVCESLHARGKQCVSTVTPQTASTGRVWDYRRLGAAVDRLRIMGYNLHHAQGSPGPLASSAWYEDILRRATARVAPAKLEMGLPAYGWDWAVGSERRAKSVTSKGAEALRKRVKARYRLDPASGTPHFTYTSGKTRRTVWYQDAKGTAEHLPVLREYGVRNTALWALNFEDPKLWGTLARG
ncbi:glycosyl hydrolase family 18 protein [Streptomyces tsukubensis]|uniref:Glycosyl hydrolase n=1 Tax=Streptomyces tsukubensis TaxID=83656 RepID=A0A1V4A2A6_9ACTN|nr:glycosyl hydrolase family 18 protein [Streptomyces tsukubensis]OON72741.1 glycosyl hydrolase [Streptomyces tsukubensis]